MANSSTNTNNQDARVWRWISGVMATLLILAVGAMAGVYSEGKLAGADRGTVRERIDQVERRVTVIERQYKRDHDDMIQRLASIEATLKAMASRMGIEEHGGN